MINEPAADAMAMGHEALFYDLAALPLATKPLIVIDPVSAGQAVARGGASLACTDTTYP
jgi:hypothetical protein